MDNPPVNIDSQRDAAGRELLRITDELGFDAQGAAWIREEPDSDWAYWLITPMIDSKGPLWVWERLLKALNKVSFPEGITPLMIHVGSPKELLFREFPVNLAPEGLEVELAALSINGVLSPLHHTKVYRMRRGATGNPRLFDARVKRLLAA